MGIKPWPASSGCHCQHGLGPRERQQERSAWAGHAGRGLEEAGPGIFGAALRGSPRLQVEMAIINRYLQHASALRKASLLRPCCRPSRTHCIADDRDAAFEEWLIANRLPGQRAQTSSSATAAGAACSQQQQHEEQQKQQECRFHWTETPEMAARCLQLHGHLVWEAQAPGVIAATRGDGQPPATRLILPRVLAGSCPGLFLDSLTHPQSQPSPLTVSPERASQQICEALQWLAAQQLRLRSNGGSSGKGSHSSSGDGSVELREEEGQQQQQAQLSIGSQLVVLLSADSAALALFQEGELARHRMLTGYTVRKQQGKAQATYQRQGGGEHCVAASAGRPIWSSVQGACADQVARQLAYCKQIAGKRTSLLILSTQ